MGVGATRRHGGVMMPSNAVMPIGRMHVAKVATVYIYERLSRLTSLDTQDDTTEI